MFENVLNVAVMQKDPKILIFSKMGSLFGVLYLLYMGHSSSFLLVAQILMAAQGRGTK